MTTNPNDFPDPPPEGRLSLKRSEDSIEISGASGHFVDDANLKMAEALESQGGPLFQALKGFGWIVRAVFFVCFGFGLLAGIGGILAMVYSLVTKSEFIPDNGGIKFFVFVVVFFSIWIGACFFVLKATRGDSTGQARARLATQPWRLTITPTQVCATQQRHLSSDDERYCSRDDIEEVFVSSNGYAVVRLAGAADEESSTMILTGSLDDADAEWLVNSLEQVFNLDESTPEPSRAIFSADPDRQPLAERLRHLPKNFKLRSDPTGDRLVISHGIGLIHRLVLFVLILVIGNAPTVLFVGAVAKQKGASEMMNFPYPEWWANLSVLIGVGIFLYIFTCAVSTLLGSLLVTATQDTLSVKKKPGFFGMVQHLHRSELQHFEQIEFEERDSEGSTKFWRLLARGAGTKDLKIFTRECEFEITDWLGRVLSDWYGVPLTRKHGRKKLKRR